MNFRKWLELQETGTSTADIAVFARPIFSTPLRTRGPLPLIDDNFEKKNKKKLDSFLKGKYANRK